jgi:parallel beta-helix repeat protein
MRRDLTAWFGTLGFTGRRAKFRRAGAGRSLRARGGSAPIKLSLGGGESLEQRRMLAVSADLNAGLLRIELDAADDVAGITFDGTNYEVFDKESSVGTFAAYNATTAPTGVRGIAVTDDGDFTNQTVEFRAGSAIAAAVNVFSDVETTKIFSNIDVATGNVNTDGSGVTISSPSIELDDATGEDALLIQTDGTNIVFDGVIRLYNTTDATISTGATKGGDIEFNDDIFGGVGEDGSSGTLTLSAGTGTINFNGAYVGGTDTIFGEDDLPLLGVVFQSAASVGTTAAFHLDGSLPGAFIDGITIEDGVNNVVLDDGGTIVGYGEDGAGVFFNGSSTNSNISGFEIGYSTYGIYAGNGLGEADLSGTVIDGNIIAFNEFGIYLDDVAGELDGEDQFKIGGILSPTGNVIAFNGEDGIYASSSTGVWIYENYIYGNGESELGGSGIRLTNGGSYLIEENLIGAGEDFPGPDSVIGNATHGIFIEGVGEDSYAGTVIVDNLIVGNGLYGVAVEGVTADSAEDGILIFNNLVGGNGLGEDGGIGGGIKISGSENIRIINNQVQTNGILGGVPADGIDIFDGSHGTLVYSNQIVGNGGDGIYIENSSTDLNPVKIGTAFVTVSDSGSQVTVDGDQTAYIFFGQQVGLAVVPQSFVPGAPIAAVPQAPVTVATVTGVSLVAGQTVIELSETVPVTTPTDTLYLTLGNLVDGNGEDEPLGFGHGISVYADGGLDASGDYGVHGLEIVGNIVTNNFRSGINLENGGALGEDGDLTNVVIAGNFIGWDGEDNIAGPNQEDGIYLYGVGESVIANNYIALNGLPNPSVGEDDNGIEVVNSTYISILQNEIYDNANDGIGIKGGSFIEVSENYIHANGRDGIDIETYEGSRPTDILISENLITDNADDGIEVDSGDRIEIVDNIVENNGDEGIEIYDSTGSVVGFNVISGNVEDGVNIDSSEVTIEGNDIRDNGEDGIYIEQSLTSLAPTRTFTILGNLIRENGDDGIDIQEGLYGEDNDGEDRYSLIGGNTIEANFNHGIEMTSAAGVTVGGENSPSEINMINLNGGSGIFAEGDFSYDAFPFGSTSNSLILGNEIHTNDEYGIHLSNATFMIVGGTTPAAANHISYNRISGIYAETQNVVPAVPFPTTLTGTKIIGNEIVYNPIGIKLDDAIGIDVGGFSEGEGNSITNNIEGLRAAGSLTGAIVSGNLFQYNRTGATIASAQGLLFGGGEDAANIVIENAEGIRLSGLLTDTYVVENYVANNTKVGIAMTSARDVLVYGNLIDDNAIGISGMGTLTDSSIAGNAITSSTGKGVLGVYMLNANNFQIGDGEDGGGNIISGQAVDGIRVVTTNAGTFNGSIEGNYIYDNGGDGIEVISTQPSKTTFNIAILGNTLGEDEFGNAAGNGGAGLRLNPANYNDSEIAGNLVANNASWGIHLNGTAANAVANANVTLNTITGNTGYGIVANGKLNGTTVTENLISDNNVTGVFLSSATGLDLSDNTIVDNEFAGVFAVGESSGTVVSDNLIARSSAETSQAVGVQVQAATNLTIDNNLILNNVSYGIVAGGDSTGTEATRNTISGSGVGLQLVNATDFSFGTTEDGYGNLVGRPVAFTTTAGGTSLTLSGDETLAFAAGRVVALLPTGLEAEGTLRIVQSVSYNAGLDETTIVLDAAFDGTSTSGQVIAGNSIAGVSGVQALTGSKLINNSIRGNSYGVFLSDFEGTPVTGLQIGNDSATAGEDPNTIAYNAIFGVVVAGPGSVGNPILGNEIYRNGQQGILLFNGGNADQAAPVLSLALRSGGVITVSGTITAAPGTYRIQLFRNLPSDNPPSFQGRQQVALDGGTDYVDIVVTGSSESFDIDVTGTEAVNGEYITATATRLDGGLPKDTSAFSNAVEVQEVE